MFFAQETHTPSQMVDVATLTGACVVALGEYAAGAFANGEKEEQGKALEAALARAAATSAERIWPMPVFPEHTKESYLAAIKMGSGIVECDVAVTKDGELVCRHSQCDLHTTTNILVTDLATKCTQPFTPATDSSEASARCCTSDITLAEYKTLCGTMDASNKRATTAEE